MKRRFADRVAIEREVLTAVNAHYVQMPLNGLTEVAIDSWQRSLSFPSSEIVDLIRNISKRVKLDVDASRDVFDEEEGLLKSTTSEYIEELIAKLPIHNDKESES